VIRTVYVANRASTLHHPAFRVAETPYYRVTAKCEIMSTSTVCHRWNTRRANSDEKTFENLFHQGTSNKLLLLVSDLFSITSEIVLIGAKFEVTLIKVYTL
jgi:hypothetical protein